MRKTTRRRSATSSKAKKGKGLQNENGQNNHKITEYFSVRRSSRKTSKQIEIEKNKEVEEAVSSGSNEEFLQVFECDIKGRGLRALKSFKRNDFVVEYKGDMVSIYTARKREEQYAKDSSIGSYMYYFKHKDVQYCIDATDETSYKGRLINHSALKPNLKTKAVDFSDGSVHLILVALRDIEVGEELLYDYGDRTPCNVANNPWLVNS
uniref:[histone H4]-lysine(20) N-methyltransferase n=1 Tax=Steinernema glaseri TaxID=37863 RepID=A0A1I7Z0Y9_9BILA